MSINQRSHMLVLEDKKQPSRVKLNQGERVS